MIGFGAEADVALDSFSIEHFQVGTGVVGFVPADFFRYDGDSLFLLME